MAGEVDVAAAELERVLPDVPALFDSDSTFYSQIEKVPVEVVSAKDMRIPLNISPGGQFGYFDADGGDLGLGDSPVFDKAVISTVNLRHAVQWTKKAEWATDSARKSVVQLFRHLLSNSMGEFRRHVNSQCMSAGDGVLATVSAVSNSGGLDTYTLGTDGFGAKLLRKGQKVNVYLANLSALRHASGAETPITFLDIPTKQIKVATVTGSAATDKILASGLSGATPVGLKGVLYHDNGATTGDWLGFNRANTPEIRANRTNASSSSLTLPFARLAVNKIGDRVGEDHGYRPVAWMHPCQKQAYEELGMLVSQINKSAKDEGLDLYFGDNMQIAGVPIQTTFAWDKTRIDFIIKQIWGRAEMHPAGFYEVDGKRIFEIRGASGGVATSQIFYLTASFNLFVKNPAACSYIDGLTVPTGY